MEIQMRITYKAIVVIGFIMFTAQSLLRFTRYSISQGNQCDNRSTSNTGVDNDIDHEYVFTVIVHGIVSLLRIVEYCILAKQFYTFLFGQDKINCRDFREAWPAGWNCSKCCYLTLILAVLLPYFVLGPFVVPSLGIYQEVEISDRCYGQYHKVYIAYSVVNVFRYVLAFGVRIVMIYCVVVLKKVWFHPSTPSEVPSPSTAQTAQEKDLENWRIISEDWNNCFKLYKKTGKKARAIQKLFQTWFIIPWVAYLIASSLKVYNVLRPWNFDSDGDTLPLIPQMNYFMYNLNQFIMLLIPYLCAKKMNTYHQKYLGIMRNNQLMKFKNNPSRLSMARQLVVVRHPIEKYDFLPRIIGTNITVSVGDPLYVISIFLAGIFISVSQSLFSSNHHE